MAVKKGQKKGQKKASPPAGRNIRVYDALLRDGTQAEEISFSVEDKPEGSGILPGGPGASPEAYEAGCIRRHAPEGRLL
jgi:hypothetical protein